MTNLDFELLRTVVQTGPHPLFATVSGAHLYGFPSPDSDVDLLVGFGPGVSLLDHVGLLQEMQALRRARKRTGVVLDLYGLTDEEVAIVKVGGC